MPDQSLQLLIQILADIHGEQAVTDAMARVKSTTREASKETEKLGEETEHAHHSFIHVESSGRAFHHLLMEITRESPLLGEALRLALNPMTGILIGTGMALNYFKKQYEEAMKAAEESGKAFAESYITAQDVASRFAQESAKAAADFQKSLDDVAQSQNKAEEQVKRTTEAIKAQGEALKTLSEVKGEGKEAQAAIDLQTEVRQGLARQAEFERAKAAAPGLAQAVAEAKMTDQSQQYETFIERGRTAISKLDEEVKKLEGDVAKAKAKGPLASLVGESLEDLGKKLLGAQAQRADLVRAQAEHQRVVDESRARVAAAEKAQLDNQKALEAARTERDKIQQSVNLHSAQQVLRQYPADAATLGAGAEALVALRDAGGKITGITKQQVDALRALSNLLNTHEVNNSTMVGLIERSFGNAEALAARLAIVESRVKSSVNP